MGFVTACQDVPVIVSPSSNRQGSTSLISAPRTVAEPSHFAASRSPRPKITRTPTSAPAAVLSSSAATIHFIHDLLTEQFHIRETAKPWNPVKIDTAAPLASVEDRRLT